MCISGKRDRKSYSEHEPNLFLAFYGILVYIVTNNVTTSILKVLLVQIVHCEKGGEEDDARRDGKKERDGALHVCLRTVPELGGV